MFNFVYKQGWIAKAFLAFLAFSFILGTAIMWGPGSWNFGFGNYLIKVGDITITPKEFLIELNLLSYKNPNLPKETLKNNAYSILLFRAVLAYLAEKNGYYVSDKEIEDFIKRTFADKNGKFNLKIFENYLNNFGLTPSEYKSIVKKILLADHYKTAVFSTTYANKETVEAILLPFQLQIDGLFYKITPEMFEQLIPNPSEEELRKIYKENLKKFSFENGTVEKVFIYKAKTSEEAAKIYNLLKESKKPKGIPFEVFERNKTVKEPLRDIVKEAFSKKGLVIKKLPDGSYVIAVYKKENIGKKIPFEKVKDELVKIYKRQKAVQYLRENYSKIVEKVLKGKINVKPQKVELIGFQLLSPEGFGFSYDDLLAILEGKRIFEKFVNNEIWILKIEKYTIVNNIKSNIYTTYQNLVRNQDYTNKLISIVKKFLRENPNEIEVNTRLLKQF